MKILSNKKIVSIMFLIGDYQTILKQETVSYYEDYSEKMKIPDPEARTMAQNDYLAEIYITAKATTEFLTSNLNLN